MRARRWVAGLLLVLLALGVAATLFARSTRALQWAASQLSVAVEQAGGQLAFTGLSGSLFSAITAARIDYAQADGTRATLTGVEIDPSLAALWDRRLVFDRVSVAVASIERPASEAPAAEPKSLALPIEVRVDRALVGSLSYRSGETAIELAGLGFAYRGGAVRHELEALSVRLPGLAAVPAADAPLVSLAGGIDATAPFALSAKLRVSSRSLGEAEFALGGPLAAIVASGTISGSAPREWLKARVVATVAPFAAVMLPQIRIDAEGIDAAAIASGAPRTALDIQVDAAVSAGPSVRGRVRVSNRLPGPVGARRLPVTAVDSGFEIDPSMRRVLFAPLRIAVNGGGSIEGRGSVSLPPDGTPAAFESRWQLSVAALDLEALDTRLLPTRLSGKVGLVLGPDRQRFDVVLDQKGFLPRAGADAAGDTKRSRGMSTLRLEAVGQHAGAELLLERVLLRAGASSGTTGGDSGEASGRGRIRLDGDQAFEADLQLRAFDPARFLATGVLDAVPAAKAGLAQASINAVVSARGHLQPAWRARIDATLMPSRVALAVPPSAASSPRVLALQGRLRGDFSPDRIEDADILLSMGRNSVRATGSNGGADSALEFVVDANEPSLLLPGFAGRTNVAGRVTGSLRAPRVKFTLNGSRWSYAGQSAAQLAGGGDVDLSRDPPRIDVSFDARTLSVGGVALSQATAQLGGTASAHALALGVRGADVDAKLQFEGGLSALPPAGRMHWIGRLTEARNDGRYPVRLAAPAALELSPMRVMLAPARLQAGDGRIQIDELRWEPGRIATRGSLAAFPAGGLIDLLVAPEPGGSTPSTAKPSPAYDSTLRIGGEWALASTPRLNGTLALRRESGDVSLRANPAFSLGLNRFDLDAQFTDDRLQAQARIQGITLGEASMALALEPSPALSMNSPMTLRADLSVRTLEPFERYLGALADIDGALAARIEAVGTPSRPKLSGHLRGERLRFDAPQIGVALRDGRLEARLNDGVLDVVQFEATAGEGTLSARGKVPLREGISAATLAWRADRMTLLSRPDRRVVVDGSGTLATEKKRLMLAGRVMVRQGYFEFGGGVRKALGDDVVVLGRKPATVAAAGRSPLGLRLDIDLGKSFRVVGSGLDAFLGGSVRLSSTDDGTLLARGTISTDRGTFAAFGQQLQVSRGQLVFNGPVDNPGIDVVAVRRFPSVEVGVEVSGTVRALTVKTMSNPPMTQGERLSWLVLGRSLDSASQADAAMLAGVAGSVFGGEGVPVTRRVAEAFGLDDIGIGGSGVIAGQVLTVGKRLSDRIYIVYEQAVTTATNLLRIDLELHKFVSLRAEAGAVSSFGIFYTRSLR